MLLEDPERLFCTKVWLHEAVSKKGVALQKKTVRCEYRKVLHCHIHCLLQEGFATSIGVQGASLREGAS